MKKNLLIIVLAAGFYTTAQVKVGNNPTNINGSALFEGESTTTGVLQPRITNNQAYAIATPAIGLIVFNTSLNCLSYYDGTTWNCTYAAPQPAPANAPLGSTYTNHKNGVVSNVYTGTTTTVIHTTGETFNNLTGCSTKMISAGKTSCPPSVKGISGTVYNLELINGQCWFKNNLNEIPTNFGLNSPTGWLNVTIPDNGFSGYYNIEVTNGSSGWRLAESATNHGILYQWSAAMNNSRTERARGNCPIGYHVPSDCEWSFLEHGLGMSLANNALTGDREKTTGASISLKLRNEGGGTGPVYNNASKFSGLLAGGRLGTGVFFNRTAYGFWWSSSAFNSTTSYSRELSISQNSLGSTRVADLIQTAYSVRCLMD